MGPTALAHSGPGIARPRRARPPGEPAPRPWSWLLRSFRHRRWGPGIFGRPAAIFVAFALRAWSHRISFNNASCSSTFTFQSIAGLTIGPERGRTFNELLQLKFLHARSLMNAPAATAPAAGHGLLRSLSQRSSTTSLPPDRRGRLRNGACPGDFLAAPRCGAHTRAGGCCRQPAMQNGRCRMHGGLSTGPRTAQGRARCARVRLKHGFYSAEMVA